MQSLAQEIVLLKTEGVIPMEFRVLRKISPESSIVMLDKFGDLKLDPSFIHEPPPDWKYTERFLRNKNDDRIRYLRYAMRCM